MMALHRSLWVVLSIGCVAFVLPLLAAPAAFAVVKESTVYVDNSSA